jgi:hypothetical protein
MKNNTNNFITVIGIDFHHPMACVSRINTAFVMAETYATNYDFKH